MTDSIAPIPAEHKEVHRQPEGAAGTSPPDPEVVARPKRRTLTIAYKIRIINAVVALRDDGHGAVGAFLRKEGLYYSAVKKWERQSVLRGCVQDPQISTGLSRTLLMHRGSTRVLSAVFSLVQRRSPALRDRDAHA